MSRVPGFVLALCCFVVAAIGPSRGALDISQPSAGRAGFELIVIEAPDCIYCHLFHRDVVPAYQRSPRAKNVPMRFVDVNEEAFSALSLQRPIDSVPTVLVLRDRREIGRIPGYVGPMNFFQIINRLLDTAE